MKHIEKVIADIDSGRAKLVEHDLIEVDWCSYFGKRAHGKCVATGRRRIKNTWAYQCSDKRYAEKYAMVLENLNHERKSQRLVEQTHWRRKSDYLSRKRWRYRNCLLQGTLCRV